MSLKLYNTRSRSIEPFEPLKPPAVRMYVCGPTVYDHAHLGHARCYVIYDLIARHLRQRGFELTYVRNITDIDDKIVKRAAEEGCSVTTISERYTASFHADLAALKCLPPELEPKVSEHRREIEALIQRLIEKGAAYESAGDVYFSVAAFPNYGALSGRTLAHMQSGASGRTSDAEAQRKRDAADFALWKGCEPEGLGAWESPFGWGRPGWHIECSAMSLTHLGEDIDLHGGGLDLVFPHHENEIAQSEAACGGRYVRHWVHNGFVEVDNTKMSKSLGNFFTLRGLFEHVHPEALRLFCMTAHYRAPLALDWDLDADNKVTGFPQLEDAECRLESFYRMRVWLGGLGKKQVGPDEALPEALAGFTSALDEALDEDLNLPKALSVVIAMQKAVNERLEPASRRQGKLPANWRQAAEEALEQLSSRLGLAGGDAAQELAAIRAHKARRCGLDCAEIEARIAARQTARAAKDFAEADRLRDLLCDQGVTLLDGPDGTDWQL